MCDLLLIFLLEEKPLHDYKISYGYASNPQILIYSIVSMGEYQHIEFYPQKLKMAQACALLDTEKLYMPQDMTVHDVHGAVVASRLRVMQMVLDQSGLKTKNT